MIPKAPPHARQRQILWRKAQVGVPNGNIYMDTIRDSIVTDNQPKFFWLCDQKQTFFCIMTMPAFKDQFCCRCWNEWKGPCENNRHGKDVADDIYEDTYWSFIGFILLNLFRKGMELLPSTGNWDEPVFIVKNLLLIWLTLTNFNGPFQNFMGHSKTNTCKSKFLEILSLGRLQSSVKITAGMTLQNISGGLIHFLVGKKWIRG